MPKVMLVEDDNNLREIYDARLAAEGYTIVSAHDGEEALALAVKERPDLIISDVMMPKISGFDMLDILRSTPETKNTKVIMMTALGQAEDRARADKLGADRYLVKSQVTLEDVIKVAHEVLGDGGAAPATSPAPAAATPVATTPASPPVEPPAVAEAPKTAAEPVATPVATPDPTPAPTAKPAADPAPAPAPVVPPVVSAPAEPVVTTPVTPPAPEPINNDLTKTGDEETKGVEQQIQDFIASNPNLGGSTGTTPEKTPTSAPTTSIPVVDTSAPAAPVSQDELAHPSPEAATNNTSAADAPSHKKLVLTPTENALAPAVDINALLEKENQKEAAETASPTPAANTVITPASQPETASSEVSTANPNDISL